MASSNSNSSIPTFTSDNLSSFPSLSLSTFRESLLSSFITLTETSSLHTVPLSYSHHIHICPALGDKPPPPKETPELGRRPDKDPFEGRWGEGQEIAKLQVGEMRYSAVNNLNALGEEHFMVVPKLFRPQASDLLSADLEVAYRIIEAYHKAGKQQFLFFNGGPLAGASQPHLHMQFFQGLPGVDELARELPHSSEPTLLPLTYMNFTASIPPNATPSQIYHLYTSLLSSLSSFLSSLPLSSPEVPPEGDKLQSYNLLLTLNHMHLIPRRKKDVEVNGTEYVLNGLSYAGEWFVESEHKARELKEWGLEKALMEDGYPTNVDA